MRSEVFVLLSRKALTDKIKESLSAVLPIGLIVIALSLTFAPIPADSMLTFLAGIVLVIVGMGLFTLGADTAMTPMGERVGTYLTKSKKLPLIIIVSFLLGVIVTVSEPVVPGAKYWIRKTYFDGNGNEVSTLMLQVTMTIGL